MTRLFFFTSLSLFLCMIFNTNLDRFLIAKFLKPNSHTATLAFRDCFGSGVNFWWVHFHMHTPIFPSMKASVQKEGLVDQSFLQVSLASPVVFASRNYSELTSWFLPSIYFLGPALFPLFGYFLWLIGFKHTITTLICVHTLRLWLKMCN